MCLSTQQMKVVEQRFHAPGWPGRPLERKRWIIPPPAIWISWLSYIVISGASAWWKVAVTLFSRECRGMQSPCRDTGCLRFLSSPAAGVNAGARWAKIRQLCERRSVPSYFLLCYSSGLTSQEEDISFWTHGSYVRSHNCRIFAHRAPAFTVRRIEPSLKFRGHFHLTTTAITWYKHIYAISI